jgi:hypothetical protein
MTLQELINLLSTMYDADTEVLSSTDDDYKIRLAHLNAAINVWSSQELWRELLVVPLSEETTNGTDKQFQLPADFKEICGSVRLYSTTTGSVYYKQIDPTSVQAYDNNINARKYYISGNYSDGFYLNFLTAPTTGLTIKYEYYKEPTKLVSPTDVIEMADPMFAIYFTLSRLYESDGATSKSLKSYQEAMATMETMVQKNNTLGFLQINGIPDPDYFSGDESCSGFGY